MKTSLATIKVLITPNTRKPGPFNSKYFLFVCDVFSKTLDYFMNLYSITEVRLLRFQLTFN